MEVPRGEPRVSGTTAKGVCMRRSINVEAAAVRAAGGTADEIDLWLQVSQQGQEDKITEPPVSHEDVVGDQLAEHLVEHRQFGGTQITTGEGQDGPTE